MDANTKRDVDRFIGEGFDADPRPEPSEMFDLLLARFGPAVVAEIAADPAFLATDLDDRRTGSGSWAPHGICRAGHPADEPCPSKALGLEGQ